MLIITTHWIPQIWHNFCRWGVNVTTGTAFPENLPKAILNIRKFSLQIVPPFSSSSNAHIDVDTQFQQLMFLRMKIQLILQSQLRCCFIEVKWNGKCTVTECVTDFSSELLAFFFFFFFFFFQYCKNVKMLALNLLDE